MYISKREAIYKRAVVCLTGTRLGLYQPKFKNAPIGCHFSLTSVREAPSSPPSVNVNLSTQNYQ
jgi:hypothetical protein